MKLRKVRLQQFRRFNDFTIDGLNDTARLVVLAGPNGCGKSSLFDAFNVFYQSTAGFGWNNDTVYYSKNNTAFNPSINITIEAHDGKSPAQRGSFYFRSAYRNEAEFTISNLGRTGEPDKSPRVRRMIESDAAVNQNFQQLASQAMEDIFALEDETTTIGQFRTKVVGEIDRSLNSIFPDLNVNSLGNPLVNGTFTFKKGVAKDFNYKNLSGGEKSAFDLILDIIVKKKLFPDAVYCIDEPETHMNTKLQGRLLRELVKIIPPDCQLWISTHSIGMMHEARDMERNAPGSVMFLDFGGQDFDQVVVLSPSAPNRTFWESVLDVALDDLAALVAPSEVINCEGNPAGAIPGKNAEHDAEIYNSIFGQEMPDVKFVAGGNAKDVAADRLGFVAALPKIARGISVKRLIDKDDHAQQDITDLKLKGVTTLSRRHLESYTYDDEILRLLCEKHGQPAQTIALLQEKSDAITASVSRGNAPDDVKSAAGTIYNKAKQMLGLTGVGNDHMAFARATLAPLIKPGTNVYAELKKDVFGP